MWKYKKILSIFLITTFISANMPIPTLAQGIEDLTSKIVASAELEKENKKESPILQEVESKREKYVKHFIKEDKTFEAVVYPSAAHYKENGKWTDIDNTLIAGKDDENSDILENKSNDYKVEFGLKSDAGKLVSIKKENYEVSWNINKPGDSKILSSDTAPAQPTEDTNASKASNSTSTVENNTVEPSGSEVQAPVAEEKALTEEKAPNVEKATTNSEPVQESTVTQPSNNNLLKDLNRTSAQIMPKDLDDLKDLSEDDKKTTLTDSTSTLEYNGIYQDVDLEYEVRPEEVKETIVLNKKEDNTYFEFNINVKSLSAKLQADKSIIFYDAKDLSKEVFIMDAPYMIDAKDHESTDIVVGLTQTKTGYLLSLKPNKEWLDSSERVYPIKIDPTVTTDLDTVNIQDAVVSSSKPTTINYKSDALDTGYKAGEGNIRSYMKFILPELKSAEMVTNARLGVALKAQASTPLQVNAYRASKDWSSESLTWNNQPSLTLPVVVEDYQMVQNLKPGGYLWDVTGVVKDWYSTGNNYGLILQNDNEGSTSGYNSFWSSDIGDYGNRPRIYIDYINNSGIEDYWTYHTQPVGRAGTGFVNDYNGNLIFSHEDLNMSGNKMPISVSHVFNSNDKATNYGYGLGWRLNLNQMVLPEDIGTDSYYKYIDEDGTNHYFKKNGTATLKDESGINLTLTVNPDESFIIEDKGGNKLSFGVGGYLYTIKDNNQNTLTLHYTGIRLSSVTDGAGRVTNLEANAEGLLIGIVDPSGRRTSFSYTAGTAGSYLSKITYPDGKYSSYTYGSNINMTSATNIDGYRITYTYKVGMTYRVASVLESNIAGTSGGETQIAYGNNITTFTDVVKSRKDTFQFNNLGNTVSTKDSQGNANYTQYSDQPNGPNKNKVTFDSKVQKTTANYLKNINAEAATDWAQDYWGTLNGSYAFTTEASYLGSKSLKVIKNDALSRQFYGQAVVLPKGRSYTLSAYIKTDGVSSSNGKGAAIFVNYQNSAGVWQTIDSSYISGTKDWQRTEVTFTIPSDAASTTIYARAGLIEETGTTYIDCLQLETGSIANRYNILENGDFRDKSFSNWNKGGASDGGDSVVTIIPTPENPYAGASIDTNCFKINGTASGSKNIYQISNVSGKAKDTFVVSGWAKADSVPITTTGRYFALDVGIEGLYGEYQWIVVPFNQDSSDWQYLSSVIETDRDYKSIKVYGLYYNNENAAYFDGFRLYKEEFGTKYEYDPNGNPKLTTDIAGEEFKSEYDAKNDLKSTTNPSGTTEPGSTTINNYTNHNITDTTSSENVTDSTTYDVFGNPLITITKGINIGDPVIQSKSTYTANGNYLKSEEDPSGNIVNFNYNETKGTLDSAIDTKGQTTSYLYDVLDRLQSVSKTADAQTITNTYSYENDRIKSIGHNGFNYNFDYDGLGNNTKVNVGSWSCFILFQKRGNFIRNLNIT